MWHVWPNVVTSFHRRIKDSIGKCHHVRFSTGRKEMFYLTTHSTYFIYGCMTLDIIMVKDHSDSERGNPLPPLGYSFRLAARDILYATPHRQDSTHNGLCYTSRRALAGRRNSSIGPSLRIDPTTHHTMS